MEMDLDSNVDDTTEEENSSKAMVLIESKSKFLQLLRDCQTRNIFCDAVIKLEDGGVFPIHRAVLSTCSSYFNLLFTTTFYSQYKTEFCLPGVDSDVMNNLLDYTYLRCIKVSHENVCNLIVAADYLGISGILRLCRSYIDQHLTPENCVGVMKFAKEYFCIDLENDVYNYIIRNFDQVIVQNHEMVTLPFEDINKIIGAHNLNVRDEEVVWEMVVKWIDHDPDARKKHVVELMSNIRLGLLDPEYFLEKVRNHKYVIGNESCKPIIIETFKVLYDLEEIPLHGGEILTPEIARPRVPHEILFVIGGWYREICTDVVESYDARADRWIKITPVNRGPDRCYHGTAVIGHNIYLIGGYDGYEEFNSCLKYNAITKKWSEIAPMHEKRCYVSVTILNNVIYAMGGYDGIRRLYTAEKYDYKKNQWTFIANMYNARSDASATSLRNKIYITGGINRSTCLDTAEVYDPKLNEWTLITNMRSPRAGCSSIAYHDHIYVIGGYNGRTRLFSCEKYNPVTHTWTYIPDMFTSRSHFSSAVIDDMIFVMGGYNGCSTMRYVECYCGKRRRWFEISDMNLHRSGSSACVIMGLPNVSEYIHQHPESLMEEKRQKLLELERQRALMQAQHMRNVAPPERQQRFFSYLR